MRQARIAFSLLAVFAVAGCQDDPQPVNQVPGPAPYDDSYATLDPVAIDPATGSQGPTAYDPAGANGGAASGGAASGVPQVAPAARTYTIKKGDTLWAIATQVYGNGQRWVDIAQANPSLDPAKMPVGQEIVLP